MLTTTLPSKVTYCQVSRHCHGEFSYGWTVRWQREMFSHNWHRCTVTSCWWRMTCFVSCFLQHQSVVVLRTDGSFRYEAMPFRTVCSGIFPCTELFDYQITHRLTVSRIVSYSFPTYAKQTARQIETQLFCSLRLATVDSLASTTTERVQEGWFLSPSLWSRHWLILILSAVSAADSPFHCMLYWNQLMFLRHIHRQCWEAG